MSLLTEYQNMLFCFNKVSTINSYGVSADAHTHTQIRKKLEFTIWNIFFYQKEKKGCGLLIYS